MLSLIMQSMRAVGLLSGVALMSPALAFAQSTDLSKLERGYYNTPEAGCDSISSAGVVQFDGKNFNGHYQLCLTNHLSDDRYQSTCIEVQGNDYKKPHDIRNDPDRETSTFHLKILSPHSFELDNVQYQYCRGE
jgi:hypothetical protein